MRVLVTAASRHGSTEDVAAAVTRAREAQRRMLEESIAIANVIPDRAVTVILDERGESMSSASFAGGLTMIQALNSCGRVNSMFRPKTAPRE